MANKKMAVAIAQDVIDNLDKIGNVRGGIYLYGRFPGTKLPDNPQSVIDEIANGCTVCAIGAVLISKIRLYDNVQSAELFMPDVSHQTHLPEWRIRMMAEDIRQHLVEFFGWPNLELIEAAFEMFQSYPSAARFGNQFENSRDRLRGIMQNIVDNGGNFIIDEKEDAANGT